MPRLGLRIGGRSARVLVLSAIAALAIGSGQVEGGQSARPATSGEHCSALAVLAEGYPVFGANMDYAFVENGLVFIIPRGLTRTGLWPGVTGTNVTWRSRFASLTFSLVGYPYAWAGVNERGLTFSTMELAYATECPPPDERPALDSGLWIQYMLDTCETVEDVIAAESRVRMMTADHYLVADRHGRRAVLEFLDGQMVVHDDQSQDIWVLTNTTYHWLLQVWERFLQQGHYDSNDSSIRRFLIGASRVSQLGAVSNADAVQFVFDTLWEMRGERFSIHTSQWSIVFDTKRSKAYFRTASHPEVREVSRWIGG